MPKIFCFDLDGTLLNSERKIHPQNLKVLKEVIKKGHQVVLASGRNIKNMVDFATEIGEVRFLITHNGGHIYDLKTQEIIYEDLIDDAIAKRVLDFAKEKKINGIFYTKTDHFLFQFNQDFKKALQHFKVTLKAKFSDKSIKDVIKIVLLKKDGFIKGKGVLHQLENTFNNDLTICLSSTKVIDITARNVNKAMGIEKILPLLKSSWKDVVVFGNGGNDILMLKKAKKSYAMKNSLPHVLKEAKTIIGDNNSLTIQETIRKNFLNK